MYVYSIHSTNCFLWTDPQSETYIGVPEFGRIYSARDLVSEAVILFLVFSAQWIAVFNLETDCFTSLDYDQRLFCWIHGKDNRGNRPTLRPCETLVHFGLDHGSLLFCSIVV